MEQDLIRGMQSPEGGDGESCSSRLSGDEVFERWQWRRRGIIGAMWGRELRVALGRNIRAKAMEGEEAGLETLVVWVK